MPRNACTRHPKKSVIEIPAGSRYCTRCHHLVPPVPKVPQEPELTEQTEAVEDAVTEAVEAVVEEVTEPEEQPEETVVEAEPELVIDPVPLHTGSAHTPSQEFTEQPLEAIPPDTVEEAKRRVRVQTKKAEEARKAKIAALEAELEALTKTE